MSNIKLVCFDLDDTLIRGIHSVMYLALINNRLNELIEIEEAEARGDFSWIEADYFKAQLAEGLHLEVARREFINTVNPISNIVHVVKRLHENQIKCILITAGPQQVADIAGNCFGIDKCYGSEYEVCDGIFTGKIIKHIGDIGKIEFLNGYCSYEGITPEQCAAVGDGASDIPLFEYCKMSIAINYSPAVEGKATHYVKTDDLSSILAYIL